MCRRGHDDWYDHPGGGKRRCRTCTALLRQRPTRPAPGAGVGPERVAELKALFAAPTEEERWDKADAYCTLVLARWLKT